MEASEVNMLTSYQREEIKSKNRADTTQFINVLLESIHNKRQIEAQKQSWAANNQANMINAYANAANAGFIPSGGQPQPQMQPPQITPFSGGIPVPKGSSYFLSPQALAQQNAMQVPPNIPQPGQPQTPSFNVGGQQFQYDTLFGTKGNANQNKQREFASSLRTEFQSLPVVKDYQVIKNQVSSMDSLLEKVKVGDGQSALALDQGLITLFNKVSDPTSVVRESEYERTPKNLSLANRFSGAFQKLESGGAGLTQDDRDALVFGAKVIADSRGAEYDNIVSQYDDLSKKFGVDSSLVTSVYGKSKKFLESGVQTFTVNGTTYRIPNDRVGEFKKAKGLK